MYFLQLIKKDIARQANEFLGKKLVAEHDIIQPPNHTYGDLSLPCFIAAKKAGESPQDLAQKLMKAFKADPRFKGTSVVGPYLNLSLNKKFVAAAVLKDIVSGPQDYGKNDSGRGKKAMVEFSNVNTHKEYHIGHLRNLCLGDSLSSILSANGYKTIPVSYVNDFGIHVAKTLWAYQKFYKYEKLPKNKGYFLGKIYIRACEELEKDETAKKMVGLIMKKIEMRRGADYELWVKTRLWSIEQFDKIYAEMKIKFKHFFYESEFMEEGKELVGKLLKKGILKKSEGAIIADLEKYGLGVLMFLRSDGTALYPVADLPLALNRIKKYKLDANIYVVDIRQNFYFKQLFKILELIGIKQKSIHLGYEFVKLPEGMMSSRMGLVITYEELRTQMLEKSIAETKKRHPDWNKEKVGSVAEKIAFGAMKFEMVKVGNDSVITFDIDNALKFDGFTAAYIQYSYTRIRSIVKKSGLSISSDEHSIKDSADNLTEETEHRLALKLSEYPEVVKEAGEKFDPSMVAKSIFELAQIFNDYYHQIPVLKAESKKKMARLMLLEATAQTLQNGLELLGIETMDEM